MNDKIYRLYQKYNRGFSSGEIASKVRSLHKLLQNRFESILDAAAAAGSVQALFLSDKIDLSKVTPQMEEAFRLQFPHMRLSDLESYSPEDLQHILNAWKGKLFEVIVRDKLNAGEWVGDLHLLPGEVAVIAESPTNAGWDIAIMDSSGNVSTFLNAKATESLRYVKEALERYPDVHVVTPADLANVSADHPMITSDLDTPLSDLDKAVTAPLDPLNDTPLQQLGEVLTSLTPFIIIAATETHRVLTGRATVEEAMERAMRRFYRSGVSAAAGGIASLLGLGSVSLIISALVRLTLEREENSNALCNILTARTDALRTLQAAGSVF